MNLTALQHSPFLQSLGWAIANSLWQAAALWITYHLVIGVYKNASAKLKHNLSTILLSVAFVWFCITLFTRYFTIEDQPGSYAIQYYDVNDITAAATWNNLLNKVAGILPYLSVAYLLLLVFLSFRLINIYRATRFIKFNGLQKPGAEWKLFTEKVARHMGITKQIRLWVSHHVDVPATIGFMKPVILIPLASINQLSADQLEAIILHELSHIKRNDYLINLFISIIETLLFFNPFIVLLAKVIKRERENCCDDFVIQYQYDRHAYASALLSLEQFRNADLRLAIGATSGKKQLLLRIKRIMEVNSNSNFNYGQKLAALLLITGVICSVAWLSPQKKETKKQLANKIKNTVSDKKINKNEKPETIFVRLESTGNELNTIAKEKNAIVKPTAKKVLTARERQLKELRDLNLKQIAESEYKFTNRLFQESKKQLGRRAPQKYNPNKGLMARGAGFSPVLFDNKSLISWANVEFNGQKVYSTFELQKLQGELDKAQFSFSFDCDKMQALIKQAWESHQNKPEAQHREKLTEAKIQSLLKTQNKNSGEILKKLELDRSKGSITVGANGKIYYRDSMIIAELRMVHDRTRQTQGHTAAGGNKVYIPHETISTPDHHQLAYAYGFATDENKSKKNTAKVNESSNTEVIVPSGQRIRTGTIYRTVVPVKGNGNVKDTDPAKTTVAPRPVVTPKNHVRIEYRNGVIVLNGKKLEMPDTNELYALSSVKGKKVVSKAKNLVEHVDH